MKDSQAQLLWLIGAIPFVVASLMYFINNPKSAGKLVVSAVWLQLVLMASVTGPLLLGVSESIWLTPDFFLSRIDAAFVMLTIGVAACALSHGYLFFERELAAAQPPTSGHIRMNYACIMLFVFAMCSVFVCKNLGYLWVCIESTTLLSAPLVYFSRTKHALEATWKYLIICSVGISFALLGTLFIFASAQHGAVSGGTLRMEELVELAPKLDAKLLRFGFIFCLLGYGTKGGMFPLHSWLPDAHSEAPAPSSALLSGSLLNCGLYAIWRISEVVNNTPTHLASEICLWAGTITVVAASLFLIRQFALKRLLAYSSIENVGMMLVAIGLNSAPLFFFQALNHSISKVSLFLLSGNITQATETKTLAQQSGLMASAPGWAVLMALSVFAGMGAPPFGTFLSEWLILIRAVNVHCYVNVVLILLGLSLSFIVVCQHMGQIFLGTANPRLQYFRPLATCVIPALLMICSLCIGLASHSLMLDRL